MAKITVSYTDKKEVDTVIAALTPYVDVSKISKECQGAKYKKVHIFFSTKQE